MLCKALEEISSEKEYQEKCLLMLVHALQSFKDTESEGRQSAEAERVRLFSKYQLINGYSSHDHSSPAFSWYVLQLARYVSYALMHEDLCC